MELSEAIHKQKKVKTPGPDSISAEFYYKFNDILSDKLKEVVSEILDILGDIPLPP